MTRNATRASFRAAEDITDKVIDLGRDPGTPAAQPGAAAGDSALRLPETRQDKAQHGRHGHRGGEGTHRPGAGHMLDKQASDQRLARCPLSPFDTALTLTPRVDRYAQVMVRCNQCSAPAWFIGHRVRVKLSASVVTVYDKTTVVARHQRAAGKGVKVLDLELGA